MTLNTSNDLELSGIGSPTGQIRNRQVSTGKTSMARYFFDIRDDGEVISNDAEGMELPDLAAAQEEAVGTLSDLARDKMRVAGSEAARNLAIEVRDVSGIVLYARFRLDVERLQ